MKRKLYFIATLMFLSLLCACGAQSQSEKKVGNEGTESVTQENTAELTKETAADNLSELSEESAETAGERTAGEPTEKSGGESASAPVILIENPSWDYVLTADRQVKAQPYELAILEEKRNQITDTEAWFAKNGLTLTNEETEEEYDCEIESVSDTLVIIFKGDEKIAVLDFNDYRYPEEYVKADEAYIEETIHDAKIVDDVLYVSTFHYTYAASAPANGYITAIDLKDYHVIWKSQSLVCNSLNFEIVWDVIFCGYGFTDEADYLYQLDKATGCVLGKTELNSKPDYVIYQDDKLYVRTYDTDYVYALETTD